MSNINLVCLVEDDPASVYWMKYKIKEANFCENLIVYSNGKEALEGLQSIMSRGDKLPEIIFLDLNMPVMDGWEFLDEFTGTKTDAQILIYIVTSSINQDDFIRAKKYETVSGYIVKPITITNLDDIIEVKNLHG